MNSLDAGLGTNVERASYVKKNFNRDTIGAKGTDLSFEGIVKVNGKDYLVSVAEAKLLRLIKEVTDGTYKGKVYLEPILSDDSMPSYEELLKKSYLNDLIEGKEPRTYGQILKELGIDFNMLIAKFYPSLDKDTKLPTYARPASGSHGEWGFKFFRKALDYQPNNDTPVVISFYNGDGTNNSPDRYIVEWMLKQNVPLVMVSTTKTGIDFKGGQIGIEFLANGKTRVRMLERGSTLDGKKPTEQTKVFEGMGLEGGYGEVGGQFFNTNIVLINYSLLAKLLKDLHSEVFNGDTAKLQSILAPDLIAAVKKGPDGKDYIQLEGPIGTALLNLHNFVATTDNPKAKEILSRYGVEKMLRIVNVDTNNRTRFFTPIKFATDHWFQAHSDYYRFDTNDWMLHDTKEGVTPPIFELENSYYNDVSNVYEAFGRASVTGLKSLTIKGEPVKLRDAILEGHIEIVNERKEPFNFHSQFIVAFPGDKEFSEEMQKVHLGRTSTTVLLEKGNFWKDVKDGKLHIKDAKIIIKATPVKAEVKNEEKIKWSVNKPAYIFLDADNFIWKGTFDLMPLIYAEIYWRIKNGIDVNQPVELSDEAIREGAEVFERMVPYSDAVALEKMMTDKGAQPVNTLDEYVSLFNRLYQNRYKQYVYIVPGAIDFLRAVADAKKQGHDIRLYMLSLGPGDFLGLNAEHLGIKGYFDGLIGPSWNARESFDKASKIIEIVGSDKDKVFVAMGGDSTSDIEAAKQATRKGVKTFSFATPTGLKSIEELKSANADLVVKSLGEVERIFNAFGDKTAELIDKQVIEKSLRLAKSLALKAGEITRKARESEIVFNLKKDNSLITKYDTEIEEMIVKAIKAEFPEHDIIAEENTLAKLGYKRNFDSDFVWIIDPIDGTRAFSMQDPLKRNDEFGTIIALLYKNMPLFSVFYAPVYQNGTLFYASELEDGTFMQTSKGIERISVDNLSDISGQSAILIDKSYRNPAWKPSTYLSPAYENIQKKFKIENLRPSSGTFMVTKAASGKNSLLIQPLPKVWDLIPAAYLVVKAGGDAVDARGRKLFPAAFNRLSGKIRMSNFAITGSQPAVDYIKNILKSNAEPKHNLPVSDFILPSRNNKFSGESALGTSPWLVGPGASLPVYNNGKLIGYIPVFLNRKGSLDTAITAPPAIDVSKAISIESTNNTTSTKQHK
ncbi:MAG: UTP--glucose-1-phosphate uridylyltransferase, partial [Candidatus Omnitrophota bacterium]